MLGRLRQEAESLALKNEQLLEVDHLKDELRQAQKMEALGQLAGGVAHDFNNLLTVLTGHAELLRPKVATDDSATRQLDAIATATERATELTRRLLTFSTRKVTQTGDRRSERRRAGDARDHRPHSRSVDPARDGARDRPVAGSPRPRAALAGAREPRLERPRRDAQRWNDRDRHRAALVAPPSTTARASCC